MAPTARRVRDGQAGADGQPGADGAADGAGAAAAPEVLHPASLCAAWSPDRNPAE